MRTFALIAFLIVVIPVPQVTRQPSKRIVEKQAATSSKLAANPQNGQQSPEATELKAISDAIAKYTQAQTATQNDETALEKQGVRIQKWLVWIGLAQTIALIITFVAVWCQARETAKATRAMRDSTSLQKTGMRQWITADQWIQEPRMEEDGNFSEIAIGIPISNETHYPLKLEFVVTELNGVEQIKTTKTLIAPGGRDIHRLWFRLRLQEADRAEYLRGQFTLVVQCRVTFTDVFNEIQTMEFIRAYNCGLGQFEQKDKYTKG